MAYETHTTEVYKAHGKVHRELCNDLTGNNTRAVKRIKRDMGAVNCTSGSLSAAGKGEGRGRDDGNGNGNSNGNGNGQVQGNWE